MKYLLLSLALVPILSFAYLGEKLEPIAKIKIAEARQLALSVEAGTIQKEELEYEKGGSGLRYTFNILHGKVLMEVGIDAQTGKILEHDKA